MGSKALHHHVCIDASSLTSFVKGAAFLFCFRYGGNVRVINKMSFCGSVVHLLANKTLDAFLKKCFEIHACLFFSVNVNKKEELFRNIVNI